TTPTPPPPAPPITEPGPATYTPGTLTETTWTDRVTQAIDAITNGHLDKVVLARDEHITTPHPIDPRWLLTQLTNSYPHTWVFAIDGLIGATPEMLIRLHNNTATSRILAGTIRRTGNTTTDTNLASTLTHSPKDLHEHAYAVTSVTDVLQPHCHTLSVPETPFVLDLPNVMHLATDVTGHTNTNINVLELAEQLHPSAAVCGTPRTTADNLINTLEGMDRGRYAGPIGWIDSHGDGEFGIALRCGHLDATHTNMRIFAGCGIVDASDPTAELNESHAKLLPMKNAFTPPQDAHP
ncbi:isochorismate synthase, partial [Dermatophilus congolensis]